MGRLITAVAGIIGLARILAALWSLARPPPDLLRWRAPGKVECDPLATQQSDPICMTDEEYRTYLGPAYQRGKTIWTPVGFALGAVALVVWGALLLRRTPAGGETMLSSFLRSTAKR